MKTLQRTTLFLACGLAALSSFDARASCGSAFCPVNTQWEVQAPWQGPGWRTDLRLEYLDQDQPRNGRDAVDVGEIPAHHDEVETVNRNVVLDASYTINERWGVAFSLPRVDREHQHIHHHHGEDMLERWNIRGIGDARAVAHYRFANSPVTLLFGLKLPTGSTDEANDEDEVAERSLQPGTGTTDAILGVAWRASRPQSSLSWFAHAQAQRALASHDAFRPGTQFVLDGGLRYAVSQKIGLLLQGNFVNKGRDRGDEAEPEDSGGTFLYLTPGVSAQFTPRVQGYVFAQLPVYQRVNGVQLTADAGFTAGLSVRF